MQHPLLEMVRTTATDFWNDSCSLAELEDAIAHGAVGATSNPTIVLEVLRKEMPRWREPLAEIVRARPSASEVEITWALIEAMALAASRLLLPVFEQTQGKKGRLSIQTNPCLYRDAQGLVAQAAHFASLAPNLQVKIPATRAGVQAIEDATAAGLSINATVCFTVAQCLAVAEAVERGLARRERAGLEISSMSPVCTLMVGRLDDWLKVIDKRDGLLATPGMLDWAGIACIKRAYALFAARGYRTRMLAAAYRHHLHWTELVGGDLVLTIPHSWQQLFGRSDLRPSSRIHEPVDPAILARLAGLFADFRRAYEPEGLSPEHFDSFGATVRTLRGFIWSYHELMGLVRDCMLPDPDPRS